MRNTQTVARNEMGFRNRALLGPLLAGAVLLWGCADLSLEGDRIPTDVTLAPGDGRINQEDPGKLELVVRDQDGGVMGVPSWASPNWKVSDASVAEVGPDGTLSVLKGGWVDIGARVAGLKAEARYCISPSRARVTAPMIYVTQAAQGPDHDAPLIANRAALLRIFLVAHPASDIAPEIRVKLVRGEDVVFERLLVPDREIPNFADEGNLDGSFNIEIPGSVLQPGVGLVVEIDPDCKAPLAAGSDTRFPDAGIMDLSVAKPQLFRQVFVPTLWQEARDDRLWNWLDGINPGSEQMHLSRNLLPVADLEVEVHDTFRTNANIGANQWGAWLNEIATLNISEGRRGYYYGVIGSSPTGLLGLANFSVPWSVGVAEASTYTHEIGHNMGLRHAPCGGAGGPDPNFPYADGSIGVWGYDFEKKVLQDPADYLDVMSYCAPVWISDYYIDLATTHRINGDAGVNLDGGSGGDRGEMLVVWGLVEDGALKLDPAIVLEGPPELPETDGPYRVEGLGRDGETMFSLSFTPTPLEYGGGSFVFFVPYEPEWATALARMVLTGPEGESTVTRDGEPPIAVVTDPSTGVIQAIIRDWDGGPLPGEETAHVTITRGIPTGGLR